MNKIESISNKKNVVDCVQEWLKNHPGKWWNIREIASNVGIAPQQAAFAVHSLQDQPRIVIRHFDTYKEIKYRKKFLIWG